jgi:cytidylate kinase
MVKIAIHGKARSGKNTLADLIIEEVSNKKEINHTKVYAFADSVKQIAMIMFPDTEEKVLWGESELRCTNILNTDFSYRQLLIDIGSLGRKYEEDIWINSLIKKINIEKMSLAVISDLRYKNEFQALKKDGYHLLKIVRPDNKYKVNHISETDLDDISDNNFYIFNNDKDIDNLRKQVEKFVSNLYI